MKKKPGKVFIDRISLRVYFIKYSTLVMLKQCSAAGLGLTFKYRIYLELYDMYAFFNKLQTFCRFTARARGVYFKFISRYKLKQYHGSGVLVGIKNFIIFIGDFGMPVKSRLYNFIFIVSKFFYVNLNLLLFFLNEYLIKFLLKTMRNVADSILKKRIKTHRPIKYRRLHLKSCPQKKAQRLKLATFNLKKLNAIRRNFSTITSMPITRENGKKLRAAVNQCCTNDPIPTNKALMVYKQECNALVIYYDKENIKKTSYFNFLMFFKIYIIPLALVATKVILGLGACAIVVWYMDVLAGKLYLEWLPNNGYTENTALYKFFDNFYFVYRKVLALLGISHSPTLNVPAGGGMVGDTFEHLQRHINKDSSGATADLHIPKNTTLEALKSEEDDVADDKSYLVNNSTPEESKWSKLGRAALRGAVIVILGLTYFYIFGSPPPSPDDMPTPPPSPPPSPPPAPPLILSVVNAACNKP